MTIVLRSNAISLYNFLSFITYNKKIDSSIEKKILDCGAGGRVPPLSIFYEQGFECCGIDTSREQLQKATDYCQKNGIDLNLTEGDMREIPFDDQTFGYVYEQYSMCHLTKSDVAIAIDEMRRVLQKGGFCFLGLMSEEAFPLFGEERNPGEFWMEENGEWVIHSVFSEEEAEAMLSDWEIIQKKKESTYHWAFWQNIPLEKWMEIHTELKDQYTPEEWKAMFDERLKKVHYDHIFYILRKPKQ